MRILFLAPYPFDQAPSQRFRFEQYFRILQETGHHYTLQSFIDQQTWQVLYLEGKALAKAVGILKGFVRRVKILFQLHHYDWVFIHREVSPLGPPVFEWLICRVWRKKVIYDFDDAIWIANTSEQNRLAARLKWHEKVARICRWSTRISCGNAYLANWASQYNSDVRLLPTTLDLKNQHNQLKDHKAGMITIGWTGTHSTLPYLQMLEPVLQQISREFPDVRFLVISNQPPKLSLPKLEFLPWKKESEVADLLKMDIGLMPLYADAWSEGKCGFKALQYMSLGIPAVVSPVGVNAQIVEHSVHGFLAESQDEWLRHLRVLINSAEERQRIGAQARTRVSDSFSVEANREDFLRLFDLG